MSCFSKSIGLILVLVLGYAVMSTGCTSMKIQDFENTTPELKLEEYFAGRSRGWGIVFDRFGKVKRQFTVDLDGAWDGREFRMHEAFVFNDGEHQERTWIVTKTGDRTYTGRAHDVIGTASGERAGQALRWGYTLRLPVGGKEYDIQFDDWMFLQPDNVLINRATMRKWGFKVGELVIAFRKDG